MISIGDFNCQLQFRAGLIEVYRVVQFTVCMLYHLKTYLNLITAIAPDLNCRRKDAAWISDCTFFRESC